MHEQIHLMSVACKVDELETYAVIQKLKIYMENCIT